MPAVIDTPGAHTRNATACKVEIDADCCGGFGQCVANCPEVFELTDDGYAVVLLPDVPVELEVAVARGGTAVPHPRDHGVVSDAIEPFRVHVDDAVLDDLRQRLERTRFPDPLPGTGWEYGTPIEYVQELVAYWLDEYDWPAQEARLNQLDQFVTRIDGQRIHFVHARFGASRRAAAPPRPRLAGLVRRVPRRRSPG